ncbi:MAG: hypothetical protein D6820_10675, partial [Lentisphaerae bacterium]
AETLWIDRDVTMGSLQNGFGSQISRFQVVISTPGGPLSITGGHPRYADHKHKLGKLKFSPMGLGCYEQNTQIGPWFVAVNILPTTELVDFCFLRISPSLRSLDTGSGDWIAYRAGDLIIAIHPLGEKWEHATIEDQPILKIYGRRCGYLIHLTRTSPQQLSAYLRERRVEFRPGNETTRVTWRDGDNRELEFQTVPARDFPGNHRGQAFIDGKPVPFSTAIYNGPYVRLRDKVLEISDGKTGFVIDVSGKLPVYRPLAQRP